MRGLSKQNHRPSDNAPRSTGSFTIGKLLLENGAHSLELTSLPVKQKRAWLRCEFSRMQLGLAMEFRNRRPAGCSAVWHTLGRERAAWRYCGGGARRRPRS